MYCRRRVHHVFVLVLFAIDWRWARGGCLRDPSGCLAAGENVDSGEEERKMIMTHDGDQIKLDRRVATLKMKPNCSCRSKLSLQVPWKLLT